MLAEHLDATTAAFQDGYESLPNQSEYGRLFGARHGETSPTSAVWQSVRKGQPEE